MWFQRSALRYTNVKVQMTLCLNNRSRMFRRNEVKLQTSLTQVLLGGEWSVSLSGRFTST